MAKFEVISAAPSGNGYVEIEADEYYVHEDLLLGFFNKVGDEQEKVASFAPGTWFYVEVKKENKE